MIALIVLAAACLVAFVVGSLTIRVAGLAPSPDPVANVAMALAAGVSVTPLLIEWLPIRWTPLWARLFVGALALLWVLRVPWRRRLGNFRRRPTAHSVTLAALIAVVVALSVLQVWSAAVPPGIDSVHHIMLTRLIEAHGGLPPTLEPFIRGGTLAYHWGAHANAAMSGLLLGFTEPFSVAALLISYAAFLRIVCCLTIYAAARSLFRDRWVAMLAAAIAAGVSALPAELVMQGRFTQLAGAAVLPAVLAVENRRGGPASRFTVTAILIAGVFLLQARLAIFAIAWVIASALVQWRRPWVAMRRAAVPLALAAVLIFPWALHLVNDPLARSMVRGNSFAQQENHWTQTYVPQQMVWLRNNGLLLSGATAGISGVAGLGVSSAGQIASVLWLIVVIIAVARGAPPRAKRGVRGRRNARAMAPARALFPWRSIALLACWIVLSSVVLLARGDGVEVTNVVPYAAAALTAFIPVILIASAVVCWVVRVLAPAYQPLLVTALLVAAAVAGFVQADRYAARSPVPAADLRAFEWVRENVPPSARFAVMAHPFNGIFVGDDAGYWIDVLTDRRSILPPMIYGWVSPVSEVERTNSLLRLWTTVAPETSVPSLRQAGVTHAYIGSSSHPQARSILRQSPRFHVIYDQDDAVVAELR